jgi:hypothetical protein
VVVEYAIRRCRARREMLGIARRIRALQKGLGIELLTRHIPGLEKQMVD